MTDAHQFQQDLSYVRQVVDQAERARPRPYGIYWIWAVYVLIGFGSIDLAPHWAAWICWIGWPVGFAATFVVGSRYRKAAGVRPIQNRSGLFWWGGSILLFACLFGVACVMPAMRGLALAQLSVVMTGIFYFLGGVHYDRNFLWLGPLLCACGLLVGLVPHYGWTALGIVFAFGLILPTLFAPRIPAPTDPASAQPAAQE